MVFILGGVFFQLDHYFSSWCERFLERVGVGVYLKIPSQQGGTELPLGFDQHIGVSKNRGVFLPNHPF